MKIFLIDGSSYFYRAFYAIRELSNSKGEPTNAIFGFTNMLLKVLREHQPDGMVIAMDSPEPTKRHSAYVHYKAQRPETPSLLIRQIPGIRRIIQAMRIRVIEVPGYEADDLLAAAAKQLSNDPANDIFIITGDKDMLQIVGKNVRLYDPMKDIIMDSDYVRERYGLPPGRIPEFMALMGDSIDNIPGVKGIGEKTAREILGRVESLAALLENPGLAGKGRFEKMIRDNVEIIKMSYELAKLIDGTPVELDNTACRLQEPDWDALLSAFREYEFTSLMKYVPDRKPAVRFEIIDKAERIGQIASVVRDQVSFKIETTDRNPVFGRIAGIAFSPDTDRGYYVPVGHAHEPGQLSLSDALSRIKPFLENPRIAKIGHNLKYDLICLRKQGIVVQGDCYDTMIASHLLNPNKSNHSLEETALQYFEIKKKGYKEFLGKRGDFSQVGTSEAAEYAVEDVILATKLKTVLFENLRAEGLLDVYRKIEEPLIGTLAEIEIAGVRIDTERLRRFSAEIDKELSAIQSRIFFIAGREFNINSPKQLGEVLFGEIGLHPVKKTKNSFSTDISVLEELSLVHELPREILQYRSLSKMKNTYLDALPRLIHPETARIHTSFNQTITATGRLSSSEPNLQNIPVRGAWGQKIREAFTADDGNLLVSADYSQIELRILAHMSSDPKLIEAFRNEIDIHSATASEIFSVPLEKVTSDLRRVAKSVNFGIVYGITPFGLSETLKCSPEEAKQYIGKYFSIHAGVKTFIEETLRSTRENGFTVTMFGRKRPIPEITSRNAVQRSQAERMAVNSPIQGTAADIIKIAMIRTRKRFTSEQLSAKIILQVHDELVVECGKECLETASSVLRTEMESAAHLEIPLKVELFSGRTWAEAHS